MAPAIWASTFTLRILAGGRVGDGHLDGLVCARSRQQAVQVAVQVREGLLAGRVGGAAGEDLVDGASGHRARTDCADHPTGRDHRRPARAVRTFCG